MSSRPKIAAFVSASGPTAAAIYQACIYGRLEADMPLVIASNSQAGEKLRELGHLLGDVRVADRAFGRRQVLPGHAKGADVGVDDIPLERTDLASGSGNLADSRIEH